MAFSRRTFIEGAALIAAFGASDPLRTLEQVATPTPQYETVQLINKECVIPKNIADSLVRVSIIDSKGAEYGYGSGAFITYNDEPNLHFLSIKHVVQYWYGEGVKYGLQSYRFQNTQLTFENPKVVKIGFVTDATPSAQVPLSEDYLTLVNLGDRHEFDALVASKAIVVGELAEPAEILNAEFFYVPTADGKGTFIQNFTRDFRSLYKSASNVILPFNIIFGTEVTQRGDSKIFSSNRNQGPQLQPGVSGSPLYVVQEVVNKDGTTSYLVTNRVAGAVSLNPDISTLMTQGKNFIVSTAPYVLR